VSALAPIRSTVVDVDLDAIAANYAALRERGQAEVIAVVKDDAYGHGVEAVSETLAGLGVAMLAVFTVEEALGIRAMGVRTPVLAFVGAADRSEAEAAVAADTALVVWDVENARLIDDAAARAGRRASVHFKVDTGLTRLGAPFEEAPARYRAIRDLPHLSVDGLFTHLATADEPDVSQDRTQLARFAEILSAIGEPPRFVHAAASAGVGAFGAIPGCTAIRPGIALYGIEPSVERPLGVRPALEWRSKIRRVVQVKKGTGVSYGHDYRLPKNGAIATVPVGYGDGLPRSLAPRGHVLVRGLRVPIVGRIAMDLIMVDMTADQWETVEGDDVVLIGAQGKLRQTADDLAGAAGTIAYEIVTGIRRRVPRRYHRGGQVVAQRTMVDGYVRR
jgi:alanine racemase